MLFLYLVQLEVLFVSNVISEKSLALIMCMASASFLESNFCNPIVAATLTKPIFVPYYEKQQVRGRKKPDANQAAPEQPKLSCYRLYTGYELNDKGEDVSNGELIDWSDKGILECVQGCMLTEKTTRKLWFVAPQIGDRLDLAGPKSANPMGRYGSDKAKLMVVTLFSDNVMAYIQSAIFGSLLNSMPCDANKDFDQDVMKAIGYSMSVLSQIVTRQSTNLLEEIKKIANSTLYVSGAGFMVQTGNGNQFGKVHVGPDDKRPQKTGSSYGTFTSVYFNVARDTMMRNMMFAAYGTGEGVRTKLAAPFSMTNYNTSELSDVPMYGRFHHKLNSGEFTEIGCVKPVNECANKNVPGEENLTADSKYKLTLVQGALPMCGVTMAMSTRQTVMMVIGFMAAEMGRCGYASKNIDPVVLCKAVTSVSMSCKFKPPKSEEQCTINTLETPFGDLLKLSGPMFVNNQSGRRRDKLDNLEWLDQRDTVLPDYIITGLRIIGDTRAAVEDIVSTGKAYNRVVFCVDGSNMRMRDLYANEQMMVQAPIMTSCSMRVFTNSAKSYGGVKFSTGSSCYIANVFSNSCVKTKLYYRNQTDEIEAVMQPKKSTVQSVMEAIEKEVSFVLPRIDASRLRVLGRNMTVAEFEELIVAIRDKKIEITGNLTYAPPPPPPTATSPAKQSSPSPPAQPTVESKQTDIRGDKGSAKKKPPAQPQQNGSRGDKGSAAKGGSVKRKRPSEEEESEGSTGASTKSAKKDKEPEPASDVNMTFAEEEEDITLSVVDDSDNEYGFDDDEY